MNHYRPNQDRYPVQDSITASGNCGIAQKYENFPVTQNRGKLLPVHSTQKMNEYLKELAGICGIKKTLSTHVARHTFATTVTMEILPITNFFLKEIGQEFS